MVIYFGSTLCCIHAASAHQTGRCHGTCRRAHVYLRPGTPQPLTSWAGHTRCFMADTQSSAWLSLLCTA
jgi:hypothetical protein